MNRMRLDVTGNAAGPVMHYEEKFISLFLFPFNSLSCMFAIVNWQTCQWLICLGVRPPHLVLALAFPYLASVSSLSLIRKRGRCMCGAGEIRKRESKREWWLIYIFIYSIYNLYTGMYIVSVRETEITEIESMIKERGLCGDAIPPFLCFVVDLLKTLHCHCLISWKQSITFALIIFGHKLV